MILMLTGCAPRLIPKPDPTQAALTSSPSSETQFTPTPTQGDILNMTPIYPPSAAPNLQSLIERAKDDLAQRLSVSVTQINVLEAREVT